MSLHCYLEISKKFKKNQNVVQFRAEIHACSGYNVASLPRYAIYRIIFQSTHKYAFNFAHNFYGILHGYGASS